MVLDAAGRVEYAFATLDEAAITSASAEIRGALPCVLAPLSAADAAAVHRATALVTFYEQNDERTRQAWASVRELQPKWEPPPSLVAPGTELYVLWESASQLPTSRVPAPYAAPGGWIVDGSTSADLPAGRPFVIQALGADGSVLTTLYQWNPDLPAASALGIPATTSSSTAIAPKPRKSRRATVRTYGTIAGAALAAGAGASLAMDATARGDIQTVDYDQIASLERTSDSATIGAIALGTASAATLGVTWGFKW